MLVAALQMGPAGSSIPHTTERVLALVDQAGKAGVKLAVLPELALTPYFAAKVHDNLDPWVNAAENQAALAAVSALAQKYAMSVVLPFAELTGDGLFNSMAFVHSGGETAGMFRKMHIPGEIEPKPDAKITILEKRYFTPGNLGFAVHDVGAAKIGGLICYDRRFPEAYRSLALNGADIIAVGYNTPVMPGNTLSQARRASELAITAGAYYTGTAIIAAGKAGKEGGVRYIGRSFVSGPDGSIIAHAKTDHDEMVLADLDMERQAKIRERWAFERNRRPAEYVMSEAS